MTPTPSLGEFSLQIPGAFNVSNALAAIATTHEMGIHPHIIAEALGNFPGIWRRFEIVGTLEGATIISDYAHHPDGVRVTLEAAANFYFGKRILTVFQPHQHNRTKKLFLEFVKVFCESPIQDIIVAEIFDVAGREAISDQDISSQDLAREIKKRGKNIEYAKDLQTCEDAIRKVAKDYDVIIIMGAGDIYRVANNLIK